MIKILICVSSLVLSALPIKKYKVTSKNEAFISEACNNMSTKIFDLEKNAKFLSDSLNIPIEDAVDSIKYRYWVFDYNNIEILPDSTFDDISFNPDGGIKDSIVLKVNYSNPDGYLILKIYTGNMYAISYEHEDTMYMDKWPKVLKVVNIEKTSLPNELEIMTFGWE